MPESRIGSASYELGADLRPLRKDLQGAEGAIRKSGAAMEKAYGQQGKAAADKLAKSQGLLISQTGTLKSSILTGVGLGAGVTAFGLVSSAVGSVVGALGDAERAAREEQAGIDQLTTAIRENDEAWSGNIDRVEEVIDGRQRLAFADDVQRESLRALVAVTGDASEALDLQRTAMDLARLKGMDLRAASDLLGKVWAGNLGTLSRYGIVLDDGVTATEALEEIQRRAAGQAEAYAKSQGKAEVRTIALENASEDLGKALIPLGDAVTDVTIGAIDAVRGLADGIGELADAAARLVDPLAGSGDELERLTQPLSQESRAAFQEFIEIQRLAGYESEQLATLLDQAGIAAVNQAGFMEHLATISRESGTSMELVVASAVRVADSFTLMDLAAQPLDERVRLFREGIGGLYEQFGLLSPFVDDATRAMGKQAPEVSELRRQWNEWLRTTDDGRVALAELDATVTSTGAALHKMGEDIPTEDVEALGLALEHVAGASLKDVKTAADEAKAAIKAALAQDSLPALRREEERLTEQRRKAMRQGEWDAVALIDARRREVRQQIEAREAVNAHYQAERKEHRQRKADLDTIQDELGVSRKKARELYDQVNKKYTLELLIRDQQLDAALAKARQLLAILVGNTGDFVRNLLGGGGGGGKGGRKDGAYGATLHPGDWGLVGELGMERARNVGGVTVIEPLLPRTRLLDPATITAAGGSRAVNTTVNVTVSAGAFLGRPLDAQRFAQQVAPAIGRELARIGI